MVNNSQNPSSNRSNNLFWILIGLLLLTGCNDSNNVNTSIVSNSELAQTYDKIITVKGVVRGEKGVIKSGEIKAFSQKKVVATSQIGRTGQYSVDIPARTKFPVVISAYPSEKSKYKVLSVVLVDAILTNHDITPASTKIAESANALGGYSKNNMFKAALGSVHTPDRDTSAAGFRGDPTKQFGGWH